MRNSGIDPERHHQLLRDVEAALTDAAHDDIVDMTITRPSVGEYRVATGAGAVTFRREAIDGPADPDGSHVERYRYTTIDATGDDPLARAAVPTAGALTDEATRPRPHRSDNHYPHGHDQIAQFFDSAHAPDMVVQHTAAHSYGGHIGQHGSLGVVQARAPFIAAGAGVPAQGLVDDSARMVDVAPTVLWLLGATPHPAGVGPTGTRRPGALLARQDGDPLTHLADHGGARHVVVCLLDGCNPTTLRDAVASGGAPHVAALADRGTTLAGGLVASMPTATLANHTTASTGVHPGHSGVLHNMWFDRDGDHVPDLLAYDQMFDAMRHLHADVETLHEAVHRLRPDAFTAAFFEFCDRGADVSSFADFRAGRPPALPDATTLPHASTGWVSSSGAYSFMTSVDETATRQAVALWDREQGNPLPTFTFLSLALTDEAGHEAGPYAPMTRAAIADSDARIGRVVRAVERAGALDDTAFVVIADHGMQESDPTVDGSWASTLDGLGHEVDRRAWDVADGFLYLVERD